MTHAPMPSLSERHRYRPYVALLKIDTGFCDFLREENGNTRRFRTVDEAYEALIDEGMLRCPTVNGRGIIYDTDGLVVITTVAL